MKREDIEIACKGLKDIIDYNAAHDTTSWQGWKVMVKSDQKPIGKKPKIGT